MVREQLNKLFTSEENYFKSLSKMNEIDVKYYPDGAIQSKTVTLGPDRDVMIYYHKNGKIANEYWYTGNELYITSYNELGHITMEEWRLNNFIHRENGPARRLYSTNDLGNVYVKTEEWKINGIFHNENGPALITYRPNGSIIFEGWVLNGKRMTKKEFEEWKKFDNIDELWSKEESDNLFQFLPQEMVRLTKDLYKNDQ
jgi:hypothetical protein